MDAGGRGEELSIGRGQIPAVEIFHILTRRLKFLVALIPGFRQFPPLFEFLGLGRIGKPERLQGGIGAREPRFSFVQHPDNVFAGYVGNSAHTQ